MSNQYDRYLMQHKENVKKGFVWMCNNLPEFKDKFENHAVEWLIEYGHDASKYKPEEYTAYDDYFYGKSRSYAVVMAFNRAWLHHIHENPHHWQYWILIHDDPNEPEECIEMPFEYIVEMICDWWSFSWASGDLTSIFTWWDEHKHHIKLHPDSRKTVETVLGQIGYKLHELKKGSTPNNFYGGWSQ